MDDLITTFLKCRRRKQFKDNSDKVIDDFLKQYKKPTKKDILIRYTNMINQSNI